MHTGENEQGLRAINDLTRLVSIGILSLHFYITCHAAFVDWHLTTKVVDRVVMNFLRFSIFRRVWQAKLTVMLLLVIFLFGMRGRKSEKISLKTALAYALTGVLLYFISGILLYINGDARILAAGYMGITLTGYLLMVTGGSYLSRILKTKLAKDIFNTENETFPQEERLLVNEYSVNLPAKYNLKGKVRDMWLNIINAARLCIIIGSPGAGKTFFLIREIIKQAIEQKQFSALIYDFKYDDLAKIAYNSWLTSKHKYKKAPGFYIINFDQPIHRCNPLEPSAMHDITDASESARTILLGLNMDWIKKTGDFFVESPINFLTAIIWYLKKYKDGIYCTLPHAIELMQVNYMELFPVLGSEAEIEVLINPFVTAFQNRALEQLEGQVGSAKIAMARLSSPLLYYVLSGNDFSLDINNPDDPKIVILANNPEKTQIYGAVILFAERLKKFKPQTKWERKLKRNIKGFHQLYKHAPTRAIADNLNTALVNEDEDEEAPIFLEQYLSFIWDIDDCLMEQIIEHLNSCSQDATEVEAPCSMQFFDTPQQEQTFDLSFETKVFELLDELIYLLNNRI